MKKGYRLYAALLSRGNFANGSNAGAWYGNWWNTPSNANWNRRVLERALYLIENYLRTIGLRIKGVWKVRKIKERLAPFLGMRFGRGYVIMGKHIMYRISRAARYAAGRKLTQHRASQLLSYWGMLKQCDSYNFRRTRFDPFVSISHCKEAMKNAHNRRCCTSGGV